MTSLGKSTRHTPPSILGVSVARMHTCMSHVISNNNVFIYIKSLYLKLRIFKRKKIKDLKLYNYIHSIFGNGLIVISLKGQAIP